jgi:hypothetical protein
MVLKKKVNKDKIIHVTLLAGMFIFLLWGLLSLHEDPDFIFDKLLTAVMLLVFYRFYKILHTSVPSLLAAGFALTLHHLKLYGNHYFGLEFDMIMHFIGGFAACLVFYDYLQSMGKKRRWLRTSILVILITAGLGTFIEITEYFGYSYLGTGEGILFYGTGDTGGWTDAVWDMIFNVFGAITASGIASAVYCWRKKKC